MSTRSKLIFASIAALALGIFLLPRLARRIDLAVEPMWEKAAVNEAQYRDMTNAFPIAYEVVVDHPVRRLYEERKAALLESGYIETRELRMRQSFASGRSANTFFWDFHSHFPGVEVSVRDSKSDQPPVVMFTARKSDLGAISQFVSLYAPSK
jgi:hypothetical protein